MFLRIAQRLGSSDDAIYAKTVELNLTGMLNSLMLDYFNFRNLLWKGEKEAVRYWTTHDSAFMDFYLKCVKESDTRRKLEFFQELAAKAAAPVGGVWDKEAAAMHIRLDGERESDIAATTRKALDFWEKLIQ
jgi:hypothetical protein